MVPKIIFIYSRVYDGFLKIRFRKTKKFKFPLEKTKKRILNYINKIENTWRKNEREILKEISRVTKLPWRRRVIHCYVVEKLNFAFSDPLTLPVQRKTNRFIDFLIHELIHIIFANKENFKKSKKA